MTILKNTRRPLFIKAFSAMSSFEVGGNQDCRFDQFLFDFKSEFPKILRVQVFALDLQVLKNLFLTYIVNLFLNLDEGLKFAPNFGCFILFKFSSRFCPKAKSVNSRFDN